MGYCHRQPRSTLLYLYGHHNSPSHQFLKFKDSLPFLEHFTPRCLHGGFPVLSAHSYTHLRQVWFYFFTGCLCACMSEIVSISHWFLSCLAGCYTPAVMMNHDSMESLWDDFSPHFQVSGSCWKGDVVHSFTCLSLRSLQERITWRMRLSPPGTEAHPAARTDSIQMLSKWLSDVSPLGEQIGT